VYYGLGDFRCEEVEVPRISGKEILIRVRACGICGTDVERVFGVKLERGTVTGHEIAGEVAEVGKDVYKFCVGDRVIVLKHVSCNVCYHCRQGSPTQCSLMSKSNFFPGGMAEYVRVLEPNVERGTIILPSVVSFEEAAQIEPAACCLRGIINCRLKPGDRVLVIGAGPMGAYNVQLLRALGAGEIIVSEPTNFRREVAMRLGADATINPLEEDLARRVREETEGIGADVVIVAVGKASVLEQAVGLVRNGGIISVFAPCPSDPVLPVDVNRMFWQEISFIPTMSATIKEMNIVRDLILREKIDLRNMVTHSFPLEDIWHAFETARKNESAMKVMIIP